MKDREFRSNGRRLAVVAAGLAAVLASAILFASTTRATPPDGVVGTPVASGQLQQPVSASLALKTASQEGREDQAASEEHPEADAPGGIDVGQVNVVKYEVEPGGMFGWHQHSGPVWVVVMSGELTLYEEDCSSTVYAAGSAFLDSGSHLHNARNEGNEPVEMYATFMLPEGGEPRIDMPQPSGCEL